MKRTLLVIIALFFILGLGLVAYSGSTVRETAPSFPTPTGDPVAGEQIFKDVTPSLTPARDPLAGERKSEEVTPSPTLAEENIVREVTPSPTSAGDPVAGEKIFASTCRVCHRKDLIHNEFIAGSTDQELVEFIKIGGVPDEPLVMPPKGGKSSLTDEKLYDIVAYLRSLQK